MVRLGMLNGEKPAGRPKSFYNPESNAMKKEPTKCAIQQPAMGHSSKSGDTNFFGNVRRRTDPPQMGQHTAPHTHFLVAKPPLF
jgi:hypothetical protein